MKTLAASVLLSISSISCIACASLGTGKSGVNEKVAETAEAAPKPAISPPPRPVAEAPDAPLHDTLFQLEDKLRRDLDALANIPYPEPDFIPPEIEPVAPPLAEIEALEDEITREDVLPPEIEVVIVEDAPPVEAIETMAEQPPPPPKRVQPAREIPPPPPPPPVEVTTLLPARIPRVETALPVSREASRTIRALKGQIVEIPFRGTGWVYLGEEDGKRGAAYEARRLDSEGQSFIFRAETPGRYRLKFSKQDFINDTFFDDAVELTVGEAKDEAVPQTRGEKARVIALPRWPPPGGVRFADAAVENPAAAPGSQAESDDSAAPLPPALSEETVIPNDESPPVEAVAASNENHLEKARADFSAGNFAGALAELDSLRAENPVLSDDVWWLYGQSFEANSPARDIKSALDAYQHIIREYPQSEHYSGARSRIAYLNRFFFNFR